MADLLNPDDALARILTDIVRLPDESVALDAALGRVLAVPLTADRDLPPFANSSVDGFAVRAAETRAAPLILPVSLDIPAGAPPDQPLPAGTAARIMTGAPLPAGADAVIPVEATDAHFRGGSDAPPPAQVRFSHPARAGDGVRARGEDVRAGDALRPAGVRVRPQDIGLIAMLGGPTVQVVRRPRVVILSTGDELLTPGEPALPGSIYDGNGPMIAALAAECGAEAIRLPIIRDTLEAARAGFTAALAHQPDAIVSSGGVSVGAFDVVRAVLEEMGQIAFWRINLRPGKPLAYGAIGPAHTPFFGLPGNPVSALVTFDVFVRPVLHRMGGLTTETALTEAIVEDGFTSDGRRSYLRVHLRDESGVLHARLTGTQSSGALSSLVKADGLLIVPEGMTDVPAGARLPVRRLAG